MATIQQIKGLMFDEVFRLENLKSVISTSAGTHHDSASGRIAGRPGGRAGGIEGYTNRIAKLWQGDHAIAAQNLTLKLADKFGVPRTRNYLRGLRKKGTITANQLDEMLMTIEDDEPF